MKEYSEITQLLNEVETLVNAYELVASAKGEGFNIFTLLGMETDEVSTHSRFLSELLNNNGSHGQKDVYLKLFIKKFIKEPFVFDTEKSTAIVEYHIGKVDDTEGGRIDILIKDLDGNVIMIENKIYAGEQHNQLLRYQNAFNKGKLFYLTLNGNESSENPNSVDYQKLSYKNDVLEWLHGCKKESVNSPILRETIQQYINLIKKLTGQNMNNEMTDDLIKVLLRGQERIEAYSTLLEVEDKLRRKMMQSILEKLKIRIDKNLSGKIMISDSMADKGFLISFENKILSENGLKIKFNFEKSQYSYLIFGFANQESNKPKDQILLELTKKHYPTAKQSDWWSAYMPFERHLNWNFSTLSAIYFDQHERFLVEVEDIIRTLLSIIESRKNNKSF